MCIIFYQPTLDENVYGFGKQVARLAQLAHIASVLEPSSETGKAGDDSADSLTVQITKVLHRYLSAYLLGQNRDKLLFDANFGGIVSINGLKDSQDDFGNGWYVRKVQVFLLFLFAFAGCRVGAIIAAVVLLL